MEEEKSLTIPKEKIDIKTIDDFLFSTGTQLDNQQKKLFYGLAIRNQLDPFKREIYAIPYKNKETGKSELSVVTGYEVYLKRAERSGKLNGWKCTTQGSIKDKNLKAIITVERKDWKEPLVHEVEFEEYDLQRNLWRTKPKTMIKKVAIAQGFRLAFPEEIGGIPYTADEIDTHDVIDVTPTEVKTTKSPEEEKSKTKNWDFLKSMSEAKKALGETKYYEILTGRFDRNHANEVIDEDEQRNMLTEMRKAYKDQSPPTKVKE